MLCPKLVLHSFHRIFSHSSPLERGGRRPGCGAVRLWNLVRSVGAQHRRDRDTQIFNARAARLKIWWVVLDSNQRPLRCQRTRLPNRTNHPKQSNYNKEIPDCKNYMLCGHKSRIGHSVHFGRNAVHVYRPNITIT